jgi:hypothetical protein
MPAGDRTGPWGGGPMTGRGMGYCAGYGAPGYANPAFGRLGRGGGRGWRHMYYATGLPGWARFGHVPAWGAPPVSGPYAPQMSAEQETQMLKEQAEWLKGQLEAIVKRLEELEG